MTTRIAATKQSARTRPQRCRRSVLYWDESSATCSRARQVERVAVAGGDTSGAIARTIGIDALEMIGPLAPGAPLCVAHSRQAEVDGVEFTFKGGQVGHDDFFGTLLSGGPNR